MNEVKEKFQIGRETWLTFQNNIVSSCSCVLITNIIIRVSQKIRKRKRKESYVLNYFLYGIWPQAYWALGLGPDTPFRLS